MYLAPTKSTTNATLLLLVDGGATESPVCGETDVGSHFACKSALFGMWGVAKVAYFVHQLNT